MLDSIPWLQIALMVGGLLLGVFFANVAPVLIQKIRGNKNPKDDWIADGIELARQLYRAGKTEEAKATMKQISDRISSSKGL